MTLSTCVDCVDPVLLTYIHDVGLVVTKHNLHDKVRLEDYEVDFVIIVYITAYVCLVFLMTAVSYHTQLGLFTTQHSMLWHMLLSLHNPVHEL